MRRLVRYVFKGRSSPAPKPALGTPRVLIFDFDGTIADTFQAGVEILNELADEFHFRRLEGEDVQKARGMRTRQLMKFLGIRTTQMARIARRGSELLSSRIQGVQPLPGIAALLKELQSRGYVMGLVTSNTQSNVAIFLRNHDLEYFGFVRCSSKLLGKAREIRSVMKQLHFVPGEVLAIGDETRDIEACKKVGIHIAAVTWGYNSREALEMLGPDFIFEKPEELLDFLKK